MTTARPSPFRRAPAPPRPTGVRRFVDPATWLGALGVMVLMTAVLWVVQAVSSVHSLVPFGLRPHSAVGLRGLVTMPFLHADWGHLAANTAPFVLIGWAVLLAGFRTWLVVSGVVVVVGGLVTWFIAPENRVIVGASALIFGWLAFLVARAAFQRQLRNILVALVVLAFFGTILVGLVPQSGTNISWQAHVGGFVAGVLAAGLLHDPRGRPGVLAPRR